MSRRERGGSDYAAEFLIDFGKDVTEGEDDLVVVEREWLQESRQDRVKGFHSLWKGCKHTIEGRTR